MYTACTLEDGCPCEEDCEWEGDCIEKGKLAKLRRAQIIEPSCCPQVAKVVYLSENGEWVMTAHDAKLSDSRTHKVECCPFCATSLPVVTMMENLPSPLSVSSDENYCDTCEERLWTCYCYPPHARFEIVVG